MFWYLVICVLMLYPYAIARAGSLTGRRTKHIALMNACLILWFFMAFRGLRVGVDTKHYAYVFSQFDDIPFSRVFTAVTYANESESWAFDFEPGYRLANKLLSMFFTGGQAGIQMDMRLDEGRQCQLAAEIHNLFTLPGLQGSRDLFKTAIGYPDVAGSFRIFNIEIAIQHRKTPYFLVIFPPM